MKLVGRTSETLILLNALKSNRPELIALYGRRRVGKTFLIRNVYKNDIQFEFAGIYTGSMKHQLNNFHLTLSSKHRGFLRIGSIVHDTKNNQE
jgi:AAA+ ATPase superfamily predicted ATPase